MDTTVNSVAINADGFGRKTANQLYKESGSKKHFKEWLAEMTEGGFLNLTGDEIKAAALGGASGAVSGGGNTDKPKSKIDSEEIRKDVGLGLGILTDLLGNLPKKGQKDSIDTQLTNIKQQDLMPLQYKDASAGFGGIPMGVWYGIMGVTVLIGGYYVYKNYIAADGAVPAVPPATK